MTIDRSGQAFPVPAGPLGANGDALNYAEPGMTFRDWLAGQALAGICGDGIPGTHHYAHETARAAYEYADAMLWARGRDSGFRPPEGGAS